jgi:hypothetical protein
MSNRIPNGILTIIIGILDYHFFNGGYLLIQFVTDVPSSEWVTFILKVLVIFACGLLYMVTAYPYPKEDLEPISWRKKTA